MGMVGGLRRRRVILGTLGLAAVAWVLASVLPRRWEVATPGGGSCVVTRGQSISDINRACGSPTRAGDQPERADGWNSRCSAPCQLRGERLLFYDCEDRLDSVEQARTNDYQGCLLQ